MNKFCKKSFVAGLTAGLVIASISLVFANAQIQAILNNKIKVSLNGQIQEFRDETTNEIQYPITYHDRTYLPLRNVAQLSGFEVDYDANSNTAILNNKSEDINEIDKYIVDIDNDGINEVVKVCNDNSRSIVIWAEDNYDSSKFISLSAYNRSNNELFGLSDYYFRIHKAKDITTNKDIYFLSKYEADGLCYEYLAVYLLEKEGNNLFLDELFYYSCNSEIEEPIRDEIRKDNTLSTEESLVKMNEAHTLKYIVDGNKVTKEEYNAYINDMNKKYELIKTINE